MADPSNQLHRCSSGKLRKEIRELISRISDLEHCVALLYYNEMVVGTKRGAASRLLQEGKRIRLVFTDDNDLKVEEQPNVR